MGTLAKKEAKARREANARRRAKGIKSNEENTGAEEDESPSDESGWPARIRGFFGFKN